MTTAQLLSYLRGLDVRLWVEGDRLRYSAPPGAVTEPVRELLKERKAEVVGLLKEMNGGPALALARDPRSPREPEAPLSHAQQRLWFMEQMEPGTGAFNIAGAMRVTGPLNVAALAASLNGIVVRHDVLRTAFATREGSPIAVVAETVALRLPVVELGHLPQGRREEEVRRQVREDARRGFDLSHAPLMRAGLLRLSPREHVLLLAMHHIVSDGWSMDVLLREVRALYAAYAEGRPSPLPDLPIQYTDFARWQRAWLQGEVLESQLAYWKLRLAGSVTLLDLPTDHPRPALQRYAGASEWLRVPEEVARGLRRLCEQAEVTLHMTLLAAYQALLARYTGQHDVLVGTPMAGRDQVELEGLIGCFLNTVVMRTSVEGNPTVRELLERVREGVLGAYDHQAVPFERLVDELQPERSLGHHPIFQVWFVSERDRSEPLQVGDLAFTAVERDSGLSKFDLHLLMQQTARGLRGRLTYNTDLFEPVTIRRMAGHLVTLLAGMAANPEARVMELPLLASAERHLLAEWSEGPAEPAEEMCLHELFARQAGERPGATAAVCGDSQLSYGELERRASRLAHHLVKLGVGPEVRVGLCLERSLELLVAILGTLKAGGAYVPLDPEHPRERLESMLEDAQARVVVTGESLREPLGRSGRAVVCLEGDGPAMADGPAPQSGVGLGNLAYVIYTSGSTGQPKGVAVEHRQLASYVDGVSRRLGVAPGESYALVSTVAADLGHTMLFPSLAFGGCLHLLGRELATDARALGRYFEERRIDYLKIVPSHLAALHLADGGTRILPRRTLVVGGEASFSRWAEQLLVASPSMTLVNHYGPTETTVGVLTCRVEETAAIATNVPLGRPLPGAQAHVLDGGLEPLPAGVAGELCIGGRGLARGYLGRGDLTAERFVPNPHGEPGSRLYRTGDRARYRAGGKLEFLGRIDQQVKLRGFRIEPGEIEAALCRHPAVGQAVVVVREDQPGERRLVAYVVGRDGQAPEPGELRAQLSARLPEPMVPSWIVVLESVPLTPNGKLDRKALPAPEALGPRADSAGSAPRTAAEQALAAIWSEVLGLERVGTSESFFALGGDSILCIQVIARAREAGYQLTLKQIFQHPTIAELARIAQPSTRAAASREPVTGPVELTPIQRWLFEQELPSPHHFNQSVLLKLREPAEAEALAGAVRELVRHHDALRLRFERQGEGWRQWHAEAEGVLSRVDLSGESEWRKALEADASRVQQSLSLTSGPLLRVVHYRLGDAGERLLVVIHHLAVDGVSWRILLEDLQRAYEQLRAGRSVELPAKTTSFQEWSRRLHEHARSSTLAAEAAYWLESESPARLPVDFPGGDNTVASARSVSLTLSEEETRSLLQEVPGVYRTQINDVLLAALARAVSGWTGRRRVVVELEGHGREDLFEGVDLSRTVGWLTTLYPVVLETGEGTSPGGLLKSVKEQLRGVPGRGIGYGLLRHLRDDELGRRVRGLPPAEIRFNYLGQFDQVLPEAGMLAAAAEASGATRAPEGRRSYLLDVSGLVADGRLCLDWTYSEAVHEQATVAAVAESFLGALRGLIGHCLSSAAGGYTPSDFPLAVLDQKQLDRYLDGEKEVEDVYPLSPMQQGLLFHSLLAPRSGVYFEQLSCRIEGEVDLGAFKRAWQSVVDRHAVLRSRFLWDGLREPLQVVRRRVALSWNEQDWRGEEQSERLEAFLRADRERGFDLDGGPPMRLALLRLEDSAYQLVWSYHHVLLDGWSSSALIKELFTLYDAFSRGLEPALERPRPYRDYIAWLQGRERAGTEEFWRRSLAGFTSPARLGVERSGAAPTAEGDEYGEETLRLPVDSTAALERLARGHQLTLSTVLQGAWALLLSRYSGEEDVVFGATVSGRPAELAGVESMLGLFINTLPVRVRVRPPQRVAEYLRELQEQQVEARQHEHSLLVDVQGWSEVERGTPLFETLLVFENYPVDASLREQSTRAVDVSSVRNHDWTHYPLTLEVVPGPPMRLLLRYQRLRFETLTIRRMQARLESLLAAMAADPGARLSDLSLLTGAERHRLLVDWNDTAAEYPADRCVHELFAEQARRTPEAVAVIDRRGSLTYAELAARADRLAAYLVAQGVGPGTIVAVLDERRSEMLALLLAIFKAGGAYLPLDPSHPPERNQRILEQARASLIVTGRRWVDRAPAAGDGGPRTLVLEEVAGGPAATAPPERRARPRDLAYVIFTSGSTGAPKGAMVEHRGLLNHLFAKIRDLGLQAGDTVAQTASQCFDISVWQLFSALAVGGTTHVMEDQTAHDPERLLAALDREGISIVETVPSLLRGMLGSVAQGPAPALGRLRWLVATGEALPPELCREWLARYPAVPVMNAYGPTECSDDVTHAVIGPAEAAGLRSVPIGRPILNTQLYIVDRRLAPVPMGAPGELHVGGDGVGRGYLHDPVKTGQAFVPDPFGHSPGGRLYRTGDLARYLPDGNIEFLGRIDHQVKVRGFRIELGEIETVLASHPAVEQAVVVVREDRPGDRRLVAYVTGQVGPPEAGALRAFAAASLPEPMVPSAFVALERMPLTANGKLDRRALPAPEGPARGQGYVAPRNDVEEVLAGIWTDVLGVPRVGVHDNFFDLGGHSLLATQVVSLVRRTFQIELPLPVLFTASTVAALALALEANEPASGFTREVAGMVKDVLMMDESAVSEQLRAEAGGVVS